jgi:hypothetical protein
MIWATIRSAEQHGRPDVVSYVAVPTSTEIVRPGIAELVSAMLRAVVERGTARAAANLPLEVRGKTGTSSNYNDTWFVGTAGGAVMGVSSDGCQHCPAGVDRHRGACISGRRFRSDAERYRWPRMSELPARLYPADTCPENGEGTVG